jgi:nitric oxide reductase subunit C
MTVRQAKWIFLVGTAVSAVILLALTVDTHRQMPERTRESALTAQAVHGKWVWQYRNCNDCHTILGIGGYYAPDVTRVMSVRDADWMRRFLDDPERVLPLPRRMPDRNLSATEIDDLIAFLTWVNGIDTNNWPPSPLAVSTGGQTLTGTAGAGASLFTSLGCGSCHAVGGIGGQVGPALDGVGGRRDRAWLEVQVTNPRAHNRDSNMPAYPNLTEADLNALVDYLAGQM